MAITYRDIPLMLEDPDGAVSGFLDQYLPLDDSRICSLAPSVHNNSLPLPYPNYAERIRPKINTLYFPTGASRWAFGYFLCDSTALQSITDGLNGGFEELVITDDVVRDPIDLGIDQASDAYYFAGSGEAGKIVLDMHLLTPRPVYDVGDGQELWILPLVDRRYFWQHPQFLPTCTSWATLFTDVETALSDVLSESFVAFTISNQGTPADEWFAKRPDNTNGPYINAAVLLDAACATVGRRLNTIPTSTGGTLQLMEAEDWTAIRAALLSPPAVVTAGGNMPMTRLSRVSPPILTGSYTATWIPETLRIVFPKYADDAAQDAAPWTEDRLATSYGFTSDQIRTGLVHYVNETAGADFTLAGGTPDNNTNIDNLSDEIATAFFGWLKERADIVFPGVHPWIPTGYDDYVEWSFQRLKNGTYQAQTRVHPMPYNFLPDRLCHELLGVEGADCPPQNAIFDIQILGTATAGDFDLGVTVDGTTTSLTFNWDDTAAEVKTTLATHANITSSDIDVTGGPFPDAEIRVEFIGDLANTAIELFTVDDKSGLTDAVGVMVKPVQQGVS